MINMSWQSRFRALLTGLVLADLMEVWGLPSQTFEGEGLGQVAEPLQGWKPLMVQVAKAVCQESPPDWTGLRSEMEGLAEYPLLVSLSALPLLLKNLDAPRERGAVGGTDRPLGAIATWANQQGLPPQTQTVLLQVFGLLQRGLAAIPTRSASRPSLGPSGAADLAWLKTADHSLLLPALSRVVQAQGQYELALRQTLQAANRPVGLVPWVGALAALQGGLVSLPLAWRLQVLGSPEGQRLLLQHWTIERESCLGQLADQLFYGWIGVSPMLRSTGSSTYPVLQMSS
jgi:hypothetical protein